MNQKKAMDSGPPQGAALGGKAEDRLGAKEAEPAEAASEADARPVVHELQVHPIELETQKADLQRARVAAAEASERYGDLFECAPVGHFLWDAEGRILEANLAGAALLGVDRSALVHKRFGQFVAQPHRARFVDFCKGLLATDAKQTCEINLLSDGQPVYALVTGIVIQECRGQRTKKRVCHAAVIDISSRKQATKAIQESEERYRALVAGVDVGITLVDWDHNIVMANEKQAEIVRGSPAELVGKKCYREYEEREEVCPHCPGIKAMASGQPAEVEVTGRRRDGSEFAVHLKVSPVLDQDGHANGFIEVVEDIRDRKRAEAALERERQTLKHLLQSSDHERRIIAYEIHDGLAQLLVGAIMQFQTYVRLKGEKPRGAAKVFEAGMTMLHQVHSEARRLISGVRPPILDAEGIVAAISHLVNEHRRQASSTIDFRSSVQFSRPVPTLENAIYRIVQEALANACKHSGSKRIQVELMQLEDTLRIKVQDWGVGFKPGEVAEDRFGLAGIRERARLLGGTSNVEKRQGKGRALRLNCPSRGRNEPSIARLPPTIDMPVLAAQLNIPEALSCESKSGGRWASGLAVSRAA